MPTPDVISNNKYRASLRRELMAEAGWNSSSGINEDSMLYATDEERTGPNAPTAHFGLIKNNGKTLRDVFIRSGTTLTSSVVMSEPRLLRGVDHNIRLYVPLVNRLHFRINQVLEVHTWRLIRFAYEDVGVNTTNFRLTRRVWPFAGDAERALFRQYLSDHLLGSLPKLSTKNPIISNAAMTAMFEAGNIFDNMNQVILTKVVKGRGV